MPWLLAEWPEEGMFTFQVRHISERTGSAGKSVGEEMDQIISGTSPHLTLCSSTSKDNLS